MDREHQLTAALSEAINAPDRPPALYPLAPIKYPAREIQPTSQPSGGYQVTLPLYGWEYKHRGPRPKILPPIVPAAIQAALNDALPDNIKITAVEDHDTYITLEVSFYEFA